MYLSLLRRGKKNPATPILTFVTVSSVLIKIYTLLVDMSILCVNSLGLFSVFTAERDNLPRNMIENSMFEEEPDVVDLAKDSSTFPVCQFQMLII